MYNIGQVLDFKQQLTESANADFKSEYFKINLVEFDAKNKLCYRMEYGDNSYALGALDDVLKENFKELTAFGICGFNIITHAFGVTVSFDLISESRPDIENSSSFIKYLLTTVK